MSGWWAGKIGNKRERLIWTTELDNISMMDLAYIKFQAEALRQLKDKKLKNINVEMRINYELGE